MLIFPIALFRIITSECTTIDLLPSSLPPTSDLGGGFCNSRLQTAVSPCARAIDCCSRARQKPTRALANQSAHTSTCANQNAKTQLRQSGCVSYRHALPAKGEFLDTSARHAHTRTLHATSRKRLYFSNITLRPHYLSLAIVPFSLGINYETLQKQLPCNSLWNGLLLTTRTTHSQPAPTVSHCSRQLNVCHQ